MKDNTAKRLAFLLERTEGFRFQKHAVAQAGGINYSAACKLDDANRDGLPAALVPVEYLKRITGLRESLRHGGCCFSIERRSIFQVYTDTHLGLPFANGVGTGSMQSN